MLNPTAVYPAFSVLDGSSRALPARVVKHQGLDGRRPVGAPLERAQPGWYALVEEEIKLAVEKLAVLQGGNDSTTSPTSGGPKGAFDDAPFILGSNAERVVLAAGDEAFATGGKRQHFALRTN